MFLFSIFFLLGDLSVQTFSHLPNVFFIYFILILSFFSWLMLRKYFQYTYVIFAFALGFIFTAWNAHSLLSWSLPKIWESKPLLATGIIASLPTKNDFGAQFIFEINKMQYRNSMLNQKSVIRLRWLNANMPLKVGDEWRLCVRLKRIHGVQNPGTPDFEAQSLLRGVRASGYVVNSSENALLSHHYNCHPIDQLRQQLQNKIAAHLPHSTTSPWLMALILGERNGMNDEDWQVLRMTGTNHLMAIAGLHIGLMAAWMHGLVVLCWRRFEKLMLWMPAPVAGAYSSLIIAILYSALAGCSLPTVRALLMLSVYILGVLVKRKSPAWHSWSFALLIVLIVHPLSVLSESFWLSFGTIALIIYGMGGRLYQNGWWWKWGRVQWVIAVGLIPLSLSLFQECSLISLVANCIAIPWLGFFILPFCFLGTLFLFIAPPLTTFFLLIADKNLALMWMALRFFSHLHFATFQQAIPHFSILMFAVLGVLFLLLPAGIKAKWIGLLWLTPLIFYKPLKPFEKEFYLTLLDVGQGLAAVVQTKEHLLIYDAGPKYSENADMGKRVLLPFLATVGAKKIDMLVISHGDNDHIGGAFSLIKALPISSIITSVPSEFNKINAQYCLAGMHWTWDGVTFSFLYPFRDTLGFGNDSSCVLKIENGREQVLLTGDIEKFAEKKLLASYVSLSASILVVPHHGSKTSGLNEFIAKVKPHYVLYPIGYRNRYHFPHRSVIASYEKIGANQLDTANEGAIQFKLSDEKQSKPDLYRRSHHKYWMDT